MLPVHDKLPDINLNVLNSAWIKGYRNVLLPGSSKEIINIPVMFALIRHPSYGVILLDTGHHTIYYDITARFPYNLLPKLTPTKIEEENNAVNQLMRMGISADDVKMVIISHGHYDHILGLREFPKAKILINKPEWDYMQGSASKLFFKGYMKSSYKGLPNEIQLIDFASQGKSYGPFEKAIDLFNDGSMILTPLPGHTVGQMGLLVNMIDSRRFFFIGDSAFLKENYLKNIPPSFMFRTIFFSTRGFINNLQFIHSFHNNYPEVTIISTHCPSIWEDLKVKGIAVTR